MKVLLRFFVGVLCAQCVLCLTEPQIKQTGKLIRRSCKTKLKADDAELDKFVNGDFDNPTDVSKCYLNCVLSMMKMVKKNGEIDYDSGLKQIPQLPPPRQQPVLDALNACRNAGDEFTDKCEIAYLVAKCWYNDNPEHYLLP